MRSRGIAIADVDGAVDYLQSFGCVRFAAPPPRILFPRGGVYINNERRKEHLAPQEESGTGSKQRGRTIQKTNRFRHTHSIQVNIPAESGVMGVLANHVPSIEQLQPGVMEIIEEGAGSKSFFRTSPVSAAPVEYAPLPVNPD